MAAGLAAEAVPICFYRLPSSPGVWPEGQAVSINTLRSSITSFLHSLHNDRSPSLSGSFWSLMRGTTLGVINQQWLGTSFLASLGQQSCAKMSGNRAPPEQCWGCCISTLNLPCLAESVVFGEVQTVLHTMDVVLPCLQVCRCCLSI